MQIKCNQLGFYPDGGKIAIAVGATGDSFQVVDQTSGAAVFSGTLGTAGTWSASKEDAQIADFSVLTEPGSYVVKCAGCDDSYPFTIASRVHLAVAKGSIKAFYYNRCSFALTEPYAGVYTRNAGHPDSAVEIHPSAASASRPEGSTISSTGGWYDAGDYGKYIVNSGISTYSLFAAYEAFPAFFDTLKLTIPESENGLPDLLDEALFNLRWMLTMQDPDDGGVYHKLTTANFCDMIMPENDTATRYTVAKSTTATLDFAAVCAQAARLFRTFDKQLPGFADSCLNASLNAWGWARANPNASFRNANLGTPAITTGEYGDRQSTDELLWAATELYIATGQDSFFTVAFPEGTLSGVDRVPSWSNVGTLALYSLFLSKKEFSIVSTQEIKTALTELADLSTDILSDNPYRIGMSDRDFNWGSNSVAANRGMSLLLGYLATDNKPYLAAALDQLDYLLGRNPTGYSYVTGFGSKTPMFIHHRPSGADGIAPPIPGFLAGGPNPAQQDTVECGYGSYPSTLPATAYYDNACSYSSNEIAINWNAPLVFLAGGIEAIYGKDAVEPVRQSGKKKITALSGVIGQRNGVLEIPILHGDNVVVTITTLTGRLLQRMYVCENAHIAATWPLQTVVVSIHRLENGVEIAPCVIGKTVAGR